MSAIFKTDFSYRVLGQKSYFINFFIKDLSLGF